MSVRLTKTWIVKDEVLAQLKGTMGVFEMSDAEYKTVFIGFAGGRSQFGLKGEVASALQSFPSVAFVRYEVTTAYHTRYRELLMAFRADHLELPLFNSLMTLGDLSPA